MKIYITFIVILIANISFSQPVLTSLQDNPALIKYNRTHKLIRAKTTIDTVSLPFFDDFAKRGIYPDSSLWLDMNVYINTTSGENPPSIGVATFDAIDSIGHLYDDAGPNQFIADKLTSKPINLDYTPADSIYLSFYYQARGLTGNAPEENDSLILEFKTPQKDWTHVWFAVFDSTFDFKKVMIPITDTTYLKKGFQFRFYNYASIGGSYLPSWSFNSDYWNLDFINLDKNRSYLDTINDLTFVYRFDNLLENYSEIPWTHYNYDNSSEKLQVNFHYKNLGYDTINCTRFFWRENYADTSLPRLESFGSDNINPFNERNDIVSFTNTAFEKYDIADSADWHIKLYIKTDTISAREKFRWNDTINYCQHFYNYYAYDDGTPENGYGISGTGTQNAEIAYKYFTIMPDTLRAFQIFFNRTRNDYTESIPIYLTVWDNLNGKPNNIIYQQSTIVPQFKDSLYKFINYKLDNPIFIEDTFFIGWQKTSEDLINIGFDNNNDTKEKLFYNISGAWVQSTFEGSLMLRPVFGKSLPLKINNNKQSKFVEIYPNPTKNIINIAYADYSSNDDVIIYNNLGAIAYKSKVEPQIDLSDLTQGIYFLKIVAKEEIITTKKIIIIH